MKLIYWPADSTADAVTREIQTPKDLWDYIKGDPQPMISSESEFIREISANEDEDGTPYLVLSWVEVDSQ